MPAPLEMYDSLYSSSRGGFLQPCQPHKSKAGLRSLESFKGSWCICITSIELKSFDIKLTIKKKNQPTMPSTLFKAMI